MRRFMLLACWVVSPAMAQEYDWSARVVDVNGEALAGTHDVTFFLRDGSANDLWVKQADDIPFADGYAQYTLSGADDSANELDAAWFLGDVFLALAIDGGAEFPTAQRIATSPRASAVVGAVQLTASGACASPANAGALRWTGSQLQVCDGSAWVSATVPGASAGGDGSSSASAGTSCKTIRDDHGATASQGYWIDPDGSGGVAPFLVHCDMSNTNGGGWTMIYQATADNDQITGATRNDFWKLGGSMTSDLALSAFTKLEVTDSGFVGWDRLAGLFGDVQIRVVGTNELGVAVDETYTLNALSVDTSNSTIETGSLVGGGVWTAARWGDTNTRNGWGACGSVGVANNSHVGFGICPSGLNPSVPSGTEVQIWHYGNWTSCLNHSFGEAGTGGNYTYTCNRGPAPVRLYLREL